MHTIDRTPSNDEAKALTVSQALSRTFQGASNRCAIRLKVAWS
jgi:hypothetical protein